MCGSSLASLCECRRRRCSTISTHNPHATTPPLNPPPLHALLLQSQAAAAQATLSKGQMGLETAVVLLESVLPSLCDAGVMSSAVPGFKESMVGLLQQLLGLRYTDPVMIALVSAECCLRGRADGGLVAGSENLRQYEGDSWRQALLSPSCLFATSSPTNTHTPFPRSFPRSSLFCCALSTSCSPLDQYSTRARWRPFPA